jgi:hypothetical protein
VIGYLGSVESFIDPEDMLDDTLRARLEQPLTPPQKDYLNTLSDEDRVQHFGNTEIIGQGIWLWSLTLLEQVIPEAAFAYGDDVNSVTLAFSAQGNKVAWQEINKALQYQQKGREWLMELNATGEIKNFVSPPAQVEE